MVSGDSYLVTVHCKDIFYMEKCAAIFVFVMRKCFVTDSLIGTDGCCSHPMK